MSDNNQQFQVGDKIILKTIPAPPLAMSAKIGSTAIVVPPTSSPRRSPDKYTNIIWDRTNTLCGGQMDGYYSPRYFSLYTPKKQQVELMTTSDTKPIGFSTAELVLVRELLLKLVGTDAFVDLNDDEVVGVARLIHRLGRVG